MSAIQIDKVAYLKYLPSDASLQDIASWFPWQSVNYISLANHPNCCYVGFRNMRCLSFPTHLKTFLLFFGLPLTQSCQ